MIFHFSYCVIVLSMCINRGDGRWREKSKKKLERDIQLFREMAENVQREIEDFYVYDLDYQKDEDFYDQLQSFTKHNEGKTKSLKFLELDSSKKTSTQKYKDKSAVQFEKSINKSNNPHSFLSNNDYSNSTKWPRFDDLLLSVGKKYDWKNDRWIKVKQKRRNTSANVSFSESKADFLSKHKFYYRFVKLNRNKSKRNVILAVKAVR